MRTIAISANTTLDEMIAAADEDDVLLLREGAPVALLSAFDEDDLEWYAREREPGFLESIARARQQIEAGECVSHEELRRECGLD